jgi:hypothetical protein
MNSTSLYLLGLLRAGAAGPPNPFACPLPPPPPTFEPFPPAPSSPNSAGTSIVSIRFIEMKRGGQPEKLFLPSTPSACSSQELQALGSLQGWRPPVEPSAAGRPAAPPAPAQEPATGLAAAVSGLVSGLLSWTPQAKAAALYTTIKV